MEKINDNKIIKTIHKTNKHVKITHSSSWRTLLNRFAIIVAIMMKNSEKKSIVCINMDGKSDVLGVVPIERLYWISFYET